MKLRARADALKRSPFRVWDIAVYALIVAAFLLSFFPQLARADRPVSAVEVLLNGAVYATLSTAHDATLDVGDRLTVVVKDGVVTVRDAHCADKVCEHMRIVSAADLIVCAPQGIVVRAAGSFGTGEIGAVQ